MINPYIDLGSVRSKYEEHGICVIDDFIDIDTISFLRDFSLNTKYRDQIYKGYSALDFNRSQQLPYLMMKLFNDCEEFLSPINNKKFSRGWFFIYDVISNGVGVHVDPLSDMTINIWVTPDSCVDAGKGFNGLDIWKIKPKPEWGYDISNGDDLTCLEYIEREQAEMVQIEYKFNRAVLFNSNYFHRSQPVRFKSGEDNRKINYTLLFRDEG